MKLQGTLGRSLWDVHRFGQRLFVGHGDGSANTGPTDIIAYHLDEARFSVEATLEEEAILRYRTLGGRLFVPGADPTANHGDGAVYVLESQRWRTLTIPDVVHVQDVALRDGRLFASIQKRPNIAAVVESTDDGDTWRTHVISGWRALALFELEGSLIVSSYGGGLSHWQDGTFRPIDSPFGLSDPDPVLTDNVPMEAWDTIVDRAVTCGDRTWAMVADGAPAHGYEAPSLQRLSKQASGIVAIRHSVAGQVSDLFVFESRCHAVTNEAGDSTVTVRIYGDDSGGTWELLGEVQSTAPAQSGTRVDGHYYLGLGCVSGCTSASGDLVRVAARK